MNIKFYKHFVKNLDTGAKARCFYSACTQTNGDEVVSIYAKQYTDNLGKVFPAEMVDNRSNSYTDYFEKDSVTIKKGDMLYEAALAAAIEQEKRWNERHKY